MSLLAGVSCCLVSCLSGASLEDHQNFWTWKGSRLPRLVTWSGLARVRAEPHVGRSQTSSTSTINSQAHHNGWRRQDPVCLCTQFLTHTSLMASQVPQIRLVTGRWLVRPTQQLEIQHCHHGRHHCLHHGLCLESQCKQRVPVEDARGGTLLPQPIVSGTTVSRMPETDKHSWSKQIIEHERAVKAARKEE